MDPLVSSIIAMVGPYLALSADQFATEAGTAAFQGVKALFSRLQGWWTKEPVAAAAVKNFATDPRRYSVVLADQLAYDIARDPTLKAELRMLVDAMGPHLEVVQQMDNAGGVTGADIGRFISGSVNVNQKIRDATDIVGVKVDQVGGA